MDEPLQTLQCQVWPCVLDIVPTPHRNEQTTTRGQLTEFSLHLQIDSLVLANLRARLEGNFRGWIMGDDDKRQFTEIAGGADLRGTDICKSVVFLERGPKDAAAILRMKFTGPAGE